MFKIIFGFIGSLLNFFIVLCVQLPLAVLNLIFGLVSVGCSAIGIGVVVFLVFVILAIL